MIILLMYVGTLYRGADWAALAPIGSNNAALLAKIGNSSAFAALINALRASGGRKGEGAAEEQSEVMATASTNTRSSLPLPLTMVESIYETVRTVRMACGTTPIPLGTAPCADIFVEEDVDVLVDKTANASLVQVQAATAMRLVLNESEWRHFENLALKTRQLRSSVAGARLGAPLLNEIQTMMQHRLQFDGNVSNNPVGPPPPPRLVFHSGDRGTLQALLMAQSIGAGLDIETQVAEAGSANSHPVFLVAPGTCLRTVLTCVLTYLVTCFQAFAYLLAYLLRRGQLRL